MHCIFMNCSKYPEFRCDCKTTPTMICSLHLVDHIKDKSLNHRLYQINTFEEATKKIVIQALIKAKKACQIGLKILISSFTDLQKHLENVLISALQELNVISNELNGLINTIINTPDQLPESNIKKTLSLCYELANYECDTWELIKINPTIDNIQKSLSELKLVTIDMSYLYSLNRNIDYDELYNKTIELKPSSKPNTSNLLIQNYFSSSNSQYFSSKKLLCPKNHEYIWNPFAPFHVYQKTISFSIKCEECQNWFSKSCWHCHTCEKFICEKCSYEMGIVCPKLVCNQNHELKYRSDINSYYKNKSLGYGYTCKKCFLRKKDSHWHCRECDYDICTECGSEAGFRSLKKKLTCKNRHNLTQVNDFTYETKQNCSNCKSSTFKLAYTCDECNYLICEECYEIQKNPMAYHPSVICMNSHFLNWAEGISYKCRYCFKYIDEGYLCKQCNFFMCGECAIIISENFFNDILKVHGKANHPILWVEKPWIKFSMNEIFCNICCKGYSSVGIFACVNCKYFLCLRCFNNS
ncbi:hypothetical protein SteCoe_32180 [Stentor coeruleus]|uniref:Uncharacterized protein n=1 Tax=Stentor coeruleus TaxID=5963 RepID=A0A1R2AZI8_9CILI|nr:hypothetical protein SteCoe_32180 [Stentor coeruleus]